MLYESYIRINKFDIYIIMKNAVNLVSQVLELTKADVTCSPSCSVSPPSLSLSKAHSVCFDHMSFSLLMILD